MKKILFLILLFISIAHANFNRLSSDSVRDDFKNSQTDKYRSDDLPELSETALVERGIIKNVSELTRAVPAGNIDKGYIRKNVTCAF
ncbi:MAG: hypothetical protein RBT59_08820, partial [Arcobacteraceae bacterium]|nr:hypothetical protein [Arcobacteraceae bacterium]